MCAVTGRTTRRPTCYLAASGSLLQMAGLSGVTGWLVLSRPAVSIVSIVETTFDVSLALTTGDYTLWPGGRLEREGFGPNPGSWWGNR